MTTHASPSASGGTRDGRRHTPWWVTVVVIVGALLTAAGAVIALIDPALLSGPDASITTAVSVYARYTFSGNVALALVLLATLALRAHRILAGLMVLTALIQLIELIDDLFGGRAVLAPGLALFAVVFLLGAARLSGHAPWRQASRHGGTPLRRP